MRLRSTWCWKWRETETRQLSRMWLGTERERKKEGEVGGVEGTSNCLQMEGTSTETRGDGKRLRTQGMMAFRGPERVGGSALETRNDPILGLVT